MTPEQEVVAAALAWANNQEDDYYAEDRLLKAVHSLPAEVGRNYGSGLSSVEVGKEIMREECIKLVCRYYALHPEWVSELVSKIRNAAI